MHNFFISKIDSVEGNNIIYNNLFEGKKIGLKLHFTPRK